jgi:hypothetical protein
LTADLAGFPAGTKVVVADVSASAGASTPQPTATATATAAPSATATPQPTATATPKPRDTTPSWKKRLMSKRFVYPVGGKSTIGGPFGAYRAHGAHEGNDLFADFGTPVVAVADGVVANVGSLPISGNRLWIYADGGDQFFYAHLASFAPAAVNDRHVEAGTILGYTGNTGDADPAAPALRDPSRRRQGRRPAPVPGRLAEASRRRPDRYRGASRRPRRGPRLHRRRMSTEDASKPTLVERMRAQREVHANRPLYVRVLIAAAGFTLLLGGVAMLVLPGPALAVIPVALAILSLEFAWAGRALEKAIEQAEKAKQTAKETSRFQKLVVAIAIGLAVVAAVAASILWEIPVIPYT